MNQRIMVPTEMTEDYVMTLYGNYHRENIHTDCKILFNVFIWIDFPAFDPRGKPYLSLDLVTDCCLHSLCNPQSDVLPSINRK